MQVQIEEKMAAARARFSGVTKIVTHPGHAHEDEGMAIAVLLALLGDKIQVERRNFTDADLQDPTILVLDESKHHEPALNNFDHHHDRTLPCALDLILQHAGLHKLFRATQPWYQNTSVRDLGGPGAVAEKYGVAKQAWQEMRSPFADPALKYMVGRHSGLLPPDSIVFLKYMGSEYIRQSLEMQPELERLNRLPVWETENGVKYVVDMEPSSARQDWAERNGIDAIFTTTVDRATKARQFLLVSENAKVVDFNQIPQGVRDSAGVTFTHNSGYMMLFPPNLMNASTLPIASLLVAAKIERQPVSQPQAWQLSGPDRGTNGLPGNTAELGSKAESCVM